MSVRIRPLRPGDVAAAARSAFDTFVDLDTRLGDPFPDYDDAVRRRQELRVAHLQRTDPDGAWVAEQDGGLLGVALALRRGPLWFLSLLTVVPERQGQGLGARLLEAALRTSAGASGAWILASSDPRALRRYALAGFALQPGYDARGTLDRSLLPARLDVRDGDVRRDADLVDDVVTRLRGAGYGPDLDALGQAGARLSTGEDGADRGFCIWAPGRVIAVGATAPALAQRLLWAGLAAAGDEPGGEVELGFLTGDQQWAIQVALAARLAVKPGSSSCVRGTPGALAPYLPSGAYG